jgi:hypothetical protein
MAGHVQHRLRLWYVNYMPTNRRATLEKGKAMRSNNRQRGALGYLLDSDKLTKHIRFATGSKHWDYDIEPYTAALVYGEGTSWAVVNDEGVGDSADDYDGTVTINYGLSKEPDESDDPNVIRVFNIFVQEVKLPWSVIDQCRTGEPIDLADHIRTFGARLDNNHAIWYRFSDKVLESV